MILENFYQFNTIERVTGNIIDLFNNIKISKYKYDKITNQWTSYTDIVPIEIGTKSKILREFEFNVLGAGKDFIRYLNLPRMSLIIESLSKDESYQTNQLNKIKTVTENSNNAKLIKYLGNPSWWTIDYTLYIISRRIEDITQIVEQILPIFQPQYPINVRLIPEIDFNISLPVTIDNSITFDINEEMSESNVRLVSIQLKITTAIPFFPPIYDSNIIKTIKTNFGTYELTSGSSYYQIQDSFNYYSTSGEGIMGFYSDVTTTHSSAI